jgi:hypothetical protein
MARLLATLACGASLLGVLGAERMALQPDQPIRAWTILSNNEAGALAVIDASRALQLTRRSRSRWLSCL